MTTCVTWIVLPYQKMIAIAKTIKAWESFSKVIDLLHLQNDVDPKCNVLYNPMACEQTCLGQQVQKKLCMCGIAHTHTPILFPTPAG